MTTDAARGSACGTAGPSRLQRMLHRTAHVLATGYILFFFSERLFWTVFRPSDSPGDFLITWLAYCAPAYQLLALVHWCRVRWVPAVFLAGAMYGWLVEGCLASTLYGTEPSAPFPVSVLCTAASWHALISVLVGWYLMRVRLRAPSPRGLALLAAAVGVFWGLWAPFQWAETPPVVTPLASFLMDGLAAALPLVFSYWLLGRAGGDAFAPKGFGLGLSGLVLIVFYAQQVSTLGLRPLLILPVLLSAGGALLAVHRRCHAADDGTAAPAVPVPLARCLLVLLAPGAATATYGLALAVRPRWPPLQVPMYVGMIVLGGGFLVGSAVAVLRQAWRRRPRAA